MPIQPINLNLTKQKLENGDIIVGIGVIKCLYSPELLPSIKEAGFDFVFIDMEHTQYSIQTVSNFIHNCRKVGVEPWVRVPDILRVYISRVLDAGATGIILPRVKNKEQVKEAINYIKFPPEGDRGFGFGNFTGYISCGDIKEYIEWGNSQICIIVEIEKKEAIRNIDDILSVKGISGVLIGPVDLTISFGVPGDINNIKVKNIIHRVIKCAQKNSVPCGIVAPLNIAKEWKKEGMSFFSLGILSKFISEYAKKLTDDIKNV